MSTPTLAQLWNASTVCDPCGCAWGRPTAAPERMAWSEGSCHLCGQVKPVAHVRWYGHLQRGFALLERRRAA